MTIYNEADEPQPQPQPQVPAKVHNDAWAQDMATVYGRGTLPQGVVRRLLKLTACYPCPVDVERMVRTLEDHASTKTEDAPASELFALYRRYLCELAMIGDIARAAGSVEVDESHAWDSGAVVAIVEMQRTELMHHRNREAARAKETNGMGIDVYEDKAGEWRWKLIHSNGKIVGASSEGYVEKSDCQANLELVTGVVPLDKSKKLLANVESDEMCVAAQEATRLVGEVRDLLPVLLQRGRGEEGSQEEELRLREARALMVSLSSALDLLSELRVMVRGDG